MRLSALCPHTGSPAANDHLKKQIQWLLFFRVLFLSLMLGISVLLQTKTPSIFLPPLHYLAYFIAGLYLFTILSALVVRMIQCYSRFGYLQITLDTLLVTLLVFSTGGSQSVFTVVYFFPIVMGAFMLFRRGSLLFAALSTLLFGALLLVEYGGYVPRLVQEVYPGQQNNFQMLLHFFTIYSLTFFLVAILSSMLSTRLQKTEAELFQTASDYGRLSFLYKQIFDDINTGIITVASDNRVTSFNPAAEQITGYSSDEILGQELSHVFPDLETLLLHDGRRHTAAIPRKNGETIPVGYSCSRLKAPEGNENGYVYTLQDLSQIKKMEAQVQQAEKMATIGEMAAGIAHELRNPLAAISGAVQLLDRETLADSVNNRLFDIILRESDRLDATIHDFLLFSKPVQPSKDWFSLQALAQEAMETLGQDPDWNPALALALEIAPGLDCWGDRQQVRQVLLNLLTNSANACRNVEKGRILLRAEKSPARSQEAAEAAIVLEIVDNGHGIPESIREKIFEPFFTTRETGTGLGLAIVRQIVHSHGGEISLRACQPQGTIFSVRLPLPG